MPQLTCRTCGNQSPHVITLFTAGGGQPLKQPIDQCSFCNPELENVQPRLELTPNWVANPNDYDTLEFEDGERVPIVKDHARGEFEQLVADAPVAREQEERAKEAKRAFARERNKFPMTPEQAQRVTEHIRDEIAAAERIMGAEAAGLVLP